MAFQTLSHEFMQMPIITRSYVSACILTTAAVQLDILTPYQLYFNPELIFKSFQVRYIYSNQNLTLIMQLLFSDDIGKIWRLFTNFCYFGPIGFNFLFNVLFTYRYCRLLEEGSFRGRTPDFFFMFLFGGFLMTIIAFFVNIVFLGNAFTIMLVYIWGRRNPFIRMNFFGLLNFHAPYLPWVLFGFSLLLGNSVLIDIIGIAVGHTYYYLEDVFPNQNGGFKILKTPRFITWLFEQPEQNEYEGIVHEERPGGFDWQNRQEQ